jgi:hypothetical protein
MLSVTYDKPDNTQRNPALVAPPSSLEAGKKDDRFGWSDYEKNIHEFRSSLNIILGYTELMLDGALGKMTEEQCDGIQDIFNSSRQLQYIVDKMSHLKTSAHH